MSVQIDCDTCAVRGPACDDERRALDALAGSGLVPPLRMVTPVSGPDADAASA
jgi:hypothetical protein